MIPALQRVFFGKRASLGTKFCDPKPWPERIPGGRHFGCSPRFLLVLGLEACLPSARGEGRSAQQEFLLRHFHPAQFATISGARCQPPLGRVRRGPYAN